MKCKVVVFCLLALIAGHAHMSWAQAALPAAFADLVPSGYKLTSPNLINNGSMAQLNFSATKAVNRRYLANSEYHAQFNIWQLSKDLMQFSAPTYRKQLEDDIQKATPKAFSRPDLAADAPVVTRFPWGAAITQKQTHKYIGAGSAPDEVDYLCWYIGTTLTADTVKSFRLSAVGVKTPEEADQWAAKFAEKAAQASIHSLAN